MAISHDGHILREWAPLTDLFNQLPQTGLFSQQIQLTCVDVLPEFIALGTNLGIVYWYDRKTKDLQRLRCENSNAHITVVKIISSVDYMVACGNTQGNISIFQIPKTHPDTLPDSLKPKKQQVERFTVGELHKSAISAIEWSKNAMKVFSGDKSGCVVLTEIDFYMHICKSLEILNEAYEVVQLSYNQQRLLVSTLYRSIICQKHDKWKVCQVGKQDRKILGRFGGVIHQNGLKTTDACLYCTRPGLRIWIGDIEGNVEKTLIFKDLLNRECPEVPIINPISRNLRTLKPQKEPSFGVLQHFNDNLLVTFSNDVVYILDPKQMTVLATISHLRGVLGVATHKDEIFILEEPRSLIRVSYKPEPVYENNSTGFLPISTSIKDLKTKLQSVNILPAFTPHQVNVHTDETLVMNAEEAKESPVKLRTTINAEVLEKFNDIGRRDFSEKILFKSKKKKCPNETSSMSSNSSEEKDGSFTTRPTLMNLSAVGVLPDLRSPESIRNDIEYKERILADVLSLDRVTLPLDSHKEEKPNIPKDDLSFSLSYMPPVQCIKIKPKPTTNNAPVMKTIPNDWKLSDIKVKERNDSVASDSSLNDWEIV